MATTHIELTLQQLLQIALGCPKVTKINLSLLQSFFDIILLKLDCRSERVEIGGKTSACLQQILRQSRISPYPFECGRIENYAENVAKAEELRKRISYLKIELRQHLAQTEQCNDVMNTHYRAENWEHFSEPTESLCNFPESEDLLGCKVMENRHYLLNLIARAITPLVKEMDVMRRRLKQLHAKVIDYKKRLNKKLTEMEEVCERCIIAERLRKDFQKELQLFKSTVNEIQDMMLAKSDRSDLMLIKKSFREEIEILQQELEQMKAQPVCIKTDKQLQAFGDTQCASCLGIRKCSNVKAPAQPCEECIVKKVKERTALYCSLVGSCLAEDVEKSIAQQMQLRAQKTSEKSILLKTSQLTNDYRGASNYRKGFYEGGSLKNCEK